MSEADSIIRAAIQDIAVGPDRGRDITTEQAQQVMSHIINGDVDEVQTAIFFIALRMKRESLDEFLGIFSALQQHATSVVADVDRVICLADPFDGYVRNATMTPFMPFVLAACGFNAVIHGVETVGPKHGVTAHKVLKMAGANTHLTPQQASAMLSDLGCCYVDQAQYAPALHGLQSLRHRMVKRSALTTLERLLMPIKGRIQTDLVLGYVHKAYPDIYARVALAAGFHGILLLKGVEGGLAPALNKPLRRFVFNGELPDDVDSVKQVLQTPFTDTASIAAQAMDNSLEPLEHSLERGNNSLEPIEHSPEPTQQCLEQGVSVLNGAHGTARDSLTLAVAQILTAYDSTLVFQQAVEKVQNCLDNGSAKARFDALIS